MRGKGIPSKLKKRGQARKKRNRRKKKNQNQNNSSSQAASAAEPPTSQPSEATPEPEEDGVSSDTSAEWFDGDEEGTDKRAYQKGGYYKVEFGQKLNGRYVAQKKVGWGHFSTVWLAIDNKAPPGSPYSQVALKIQKSASHYTEAALDEIELLAAAANPNIARRYMQNANLEEQGSRGSDPSSTEAGGSPDQDANGDDMKEPSARDAKGEAANGVQESSDTHNGTDADALSDQPPPLEQANPAEVARMQGSNVVQLLDHFFVYGSSGKHVVMVFELLGENLLDVIKRYDYNGMPIAIVKKVVKEMLQGLHHLHTNCHIIHTDLKPENVLLKAKGLVSVKEVQEEQDHILLKRTESTIKRLKETLSDEQQKKKLNKNQKKRIKQKLKKMEKRLEAARQSGKKIPSEKPKIRKNPLLSMPPDCVIADLGNACWTHKHFTDDITTRQYRGPESIIGQPYDCAVDIWSLACMAFEFLTGDYLFNAKESKNGTYRRDEDHLALIQELCGEFPPHMTATGRYAGEYFNRKGELRHIRRLEYWPLDSVLREKYKMNGREARRFASFLMPMLQVDPRRRATAAEALQHPWLEITDDDYLNFMNHTKEALEDRERELREHDERMKERKREEAGEEATPRKRRRRRRRWHSCPACYSLELQGHDPMKYPPGDYHSEDDGHGSVDQYPDRGDYPPEELLAQMNGVPMHHDEPPLAPAELDDRGSDPEVAMDDKLPQDGDGGF